MFKCHLEKKLYNLPPHIELKILKAHKANTRVQCAFCLLSVLGLLLMLGVFYSKNIVGYLESHKKHSFFDLMLNFRSDIISNYTGLSAILSSIFELLPALSLIFSTLFSYILFKKTISAWALLFKLLTKVFWLSYVFETIMQIVLQGFDRGKFAIFIVTAKLLIDTIFLIFFYTYLNNQTSYDFDLLVKYKYSIFSRLISRKGCRL